MTSTSTTATSDSAIKLAKKKLRSEIGTKLGQLSSAEIDRQSQLLHQNLYVLPEFQRAKRVGLYLSLPLEIDTLRILAHCFELGKKCFVPKYWPKSRRMDFVELYSMQDYEDLPLEPKWQIKQPDPADESRAEALSTGGMDILLVPGVAFTREGLRLGHGMGYFDTWLARCFRTPDIVHPVTVALSLHQQIVTDLPVTDFDVRIDRILTP